MTMLEQARMHQDVTNETNGTEVAGEGALGQQEGGVILEEEGVAVLEEDFNRVQIATAAGIGTIKADQILTGIDRRFQKTILTEETTKGKVLERIR